MSEQPLIGFEAIDKAIGPFEAFEFCGIGSYGETYRVVKSGAEFAVKLIHTVGLPDWAVRREVEAMRRVRHPAVMGFIESGTLEADGETYPYFLCEFVPGETVFGKLNAGEVPPSAEDVRAMLRGLLQGVGALHEAQILHRDISARNVMLRDGDWKRPVLLDFGLARVLDMSGHTVYPRTIGTPLYMSPEQLSGQPAGKRSDMFSVAAVVYHGATHRHPYEAETYPTIDLLLQRMSEGPPIDPRQVSTVFDDETAKVVMRLLVYDGYERLSIQRALEDLSDR